MKRNKRFLSALAALLLLLLTACGPAAPGPTVPPSSESGPPAPTGPTVRPPAPTETVPPETYPMPTMPEPERFTLSFAGDCTFGDNFDAEDRSGTFCKVVKDRYDYPLSNVRSIFESDDYSFVNLECALTESDPTEEEMEELLDHRFRFRGPAEYAKILTMGGVEAATCANNHSRDYGRQGWLDTLEALKAESISYASFGIPSLITTDSGLKIGLMTAFFSFTEGQIQSQVKRFREQGAEIVILSVHWGDEGVYAPNPEQRSMGRMAIDAGVDIVFGHHSHTLQPVEAYHGGVIYYSLGNFSFGGNVNPGDKDTAVIQQEILRYPDGSVALGGLKIIPCRVSTSDTWNDYRPTPYDRDHPGYQRVFDKLEGSYDASDLPAPAVP